MRPKRSCIYAEAALFFQHLNSTQTTTPTSHEIHPPSSPPAAVALLLTAVRQKTTTTITAAKPPCRNVNANNARQNADLARLEFPHVRGGSSLVIVHTCLLNSRNGETGVNYSTEWDAEKRAQRWSCYQMYEHARRQHLALLSDQHHSRATSQYPQRRVHHHTDYQLPTDPYWGSGYDHGHICPSADRLSSFDCNYQTFYLTNMQPQVNGFNAGTWQYMENMMRTWNRNDFRDTLYVCKGGTIDNKENIMRYIGTGASQIPVPKYFFMALLCKNSQGYKAMAFWIEHKAGYDDGNALKQYVISIDELEEKTGIDFLEFHN